MSARSAGPALAKPVRLPWRRLLAHAIWLAGVVAVVLFVYLAVVLGLGRAPTDGERTILALSLAAAVVAALVTLAARERLMRFSARLVFGDLLPPDEVLRTFSSRLTRAVPLDELLLQLAESLRRSFGLAVAELWTGSDGRLERAASDPEQGSARLSLTPAEEGIVAGGGVSGTAWAKVWLAPLAAGREESLLRVVPVTHSGKLLGLLVVERSPGSGSLTAEEERVLQELAREVGLVLHNVRLDSALEATLEEVRRQAEELRASRARIVAAADAERRRIERDLHDGAQQRLLSLAVKVRLARELAPRDTAEAEAILAELGSDLEQGLDELRDFAHGIYPPLLAESGLAGALAGAAARVSLPTTVDVRTTERYHPEAEAAAYFCCLEALQNAGKHAGEGATATILVREEEGGLAFKIEDDGGGFDPRRQRGGAGFLNMSDRLGAIGGVLRVESAPGLGTRVSGLIPLRPAARPGTRAQP